MAATAQLRVSNPVEAQAGWDRVGTTPNELASWMTRVFSVDISGLDPVPYIIGDVPPVNATDKQKVFFNNGAIPAIGIPQNNGSSYAMFYQYPAYVPFLWILGDSAKPAFLRKLSVSELASMSLTAPVNSGYYYVIFEP